MSLATAILRPEALQSVDADDLLGLGEDVARAVAIILEDAAEAGPMAGAAERALFTATADLAASLDRRRAKAEGSLRARIAVGRQALEGFTAAAETGPQDSAAVARLLRQLVGWLTGLSEAATLPAIRAELNFWKALIEDDLEFSPESIGMLVATYVRALRGEFATLESSDLAAVRRIRLCESVLVRLSGRIAELRPPAINIEPIALEIHKLLLSGGFAAALREFSCALRDVDKALVAAVAVGEVVRPPLSPVGAGVVTLRSSMNYSWYPSWLLNDEDVPLLGLSDISNPKAFLRQLKGDGTIERHLREDLFQPAERNVLTDLAGDAEPSRDLLLSVLAAVNRVMQSVTILERPFDESLLPDSALNDTIRKLRRDYVTDQDLILYNRRLLEHVFRGLIDGFSGGSFFAGIIHWSRNQVFVTGDGRYVMCDDKPIHSGENVAWSDAPLFADEVRGRMWFKFDHFSPRACELTAQVLAAGIETGKSIWHFVETQPGHEAQAVSVGLIEAVDAIQQVLFGRPIGAWFLEKGSGVRGWGKSLDSAFGLKTIATLASSFQGLHTAAPAGNSFLCWVTVVLGDIFRTAGPVQMLNTGRDLVLGFMTLLNFGGPRAEPSTLPTNPAWNHRKQAPWVSLSDTLFAMLLISLYPRDSYSIAMWDPGDDVPGSRRAEAFFGHWLGGSAGLGLLAGLSGSLVAQINAWSEDWERFFKTGGFSALKMFALYWLYQYLFRENATDGGRYRAGGGSFAGYPDKNRAPSPYRLPYAGGTGLYVGQANLGLFSHNFISNTNFTTPANSATQQVYAYDFSHDFRQGIACARAGVVWQFTEGMADSSTGTWNSIIIRHTTIDPVHDNFGSGPVQTYAVYGHLAQNGVTQAPRFGGTSPIQESATPGGGTAVAQGDIIALAGDTGISFHNHLHMHILPDNGAGAPNFNFAIPFVFDDVGGDGVPQSRTWHRSGNS